MLLHLASIGVVVFFFVTKNLKIAKVYNKHLLSHPRICRMAVAWLIQVGLGWLRLGPRLPAGLRFLPTQVHSRGAQATWGLPLEQ